MTAKEWHRAYVVAGLPAGAQCCRQNPCRCWSHGWTAKRTLRANLPVQRKVRIHRHFFAPKDGWTGWTGRFTTLYKNEQFVPCTLLA